MTRVTPSEVECLIGTSLEDCIVQVWIDTASSIVDSKADCINGSDELLANIEKQLAAHFIALSTPSLGGIVTSERFETMSVNYATANVATTINQTVYGMAANALSNGCLAAIDEAQATVDFF